MPDAADIARGFLEELDRDRVGDLLRDYKNGIHNRVTTLEEAYQLANNYVVQSHKAKGVRPIFRTSGSGRGRDNNNRTGRGRTNNHIKHMKFGPSAELFYFFIKSLSGYLL